MSASKQAETNVDWVAKVKKEGEVTVRMKAQTTDDADAMEMSFPVYVHGALRTESWSGVLRPGEKQGIITLEVPKERRPEQSNLEIRYSPSIALAMVDALPYLANYSHKNCESVINRFVPVVLSQKILKDLGVDLKNIAKKATNLNPQEIGDAGERVEAAQRTKQEPHLRRGQSESYGQDGFGRSHQDAERGRRLELDAWWGFGYLHDCAGREQPQACQG